MNETLRSLRLARFGEAVQAVQSESTSNGTDQLSDEEIQAEIDAVRREMRGI